MLNGTSDHLRYVSLHSAFGGARLLGSCLMRNLRMLTPTALQPAVANPRAATAMFWFAVATIFVQVFLGYGVFQAAGIDPRTVKLNPATVMAMIGGIWVLVRGVPFHQRCRETPALALFVVMVPVLAAYSTVFTGVSGAAIYPETYWSAGLLALMLEPATPKQKRLLAKLLIGICLVNIFVALYESMTYSAVLPPVFDPDKIDVIKDADVNFRANAFFSHPLTGTLITTMGVFLLYAMRMRLIFSAPILCLMILGLLSYGGRTGLGVTLLLTVSAAFYTLINGIIRRNLKLEFVLLLLAGAIIIPIFVTIIVTQTTIAERIMNTLYFDDSAEVRSTQFKIFQLMTLPDWLFGMTRDRLIFLKYQIGLGTLHTDIENFWILMLVNLGLIGFAVYCAVLMTYLYYLGRVSGSMYGWLLVIGSLIIDSGSNSLGAKTYDLFMETAFVYAMSGYAGYSRSARMAMPRVWARLKPAGRRNGGLGEVAAPASRSLTVMASRPS